MVASAVGELPEVLAGGAGVLVPAGDVRALSEALARVKNGQVRAQIQSARPLQRAPVDNHYNFQRWLHLWLRLELRNHSAATEVRRSCFCYEDFGRQRQDLIDRQPGLCGDLIALPGQGVSDCCERGTPEI